MKFDDVVCVSLACSSSTENSPLNLAKSRKKLLFFSPPYFQCLCNSCTSSQLILAIRRVEDYVCSIVSSVEVQMGYQWSAIHWFLLLFWDKRLLRPRLSVRFGWNWAMLCQDARVHIFISLEHHFKCTLKSAQHSKSDSVIESPRAWKTTKIWHVQRNGLLSSDQGVRGKKI